MADFSPAPTVNWFSPGLRSFGDLVAELNAAGSQGVLTSGYYDQIARKRDQILSGLSDTDLALVARAYYGGQNAYDRNEFMRQRQVDDVANRNKWAQGDAPTWSSQADSVRRNGQQIDMRRSDGSWQTIGSPNLSMFVSLADRLGKSQPGAADYRNAINERYYLMQGMGDDELEALDRQYYGNKGFDGDRTSFLTYLNNQDVGTLRGMGDEDAVNELGGTFMSTMPGASPKNNEGQPLLSPQPATPKAPPKATAPVRQGRSAGDLISQSITGARIVR